MTGSSLSLNEARTVGPFGHPDHPDVSDCAGPPKTTCQPREIFPVAFISENALPSKDTTGRLAQVLPAMIVMPCDWADAAMLALPVEIVQAGQDGWTDGERPLQADIVHLSAIGVLVLSGEAAALAAQHARVWHASFGEPAPPVLEVAKKEKARLETILRWICGRLAEDQGRTAHRIVTQARELAVLRQQHEATQSAFRNLETYAYEHNLTQRQLQMTLAPAVESPHLVLAPGSFLDQRLPGKSVGLSDLSLRIADGAKPRSGTLECWLESPDLGQELARWLVPAERLVPGWLRLSLEVALDADPVSLVLHAQWSGSSDVRLETAMRHPDPRFCPVVDGAEGGFVPAMQLWHFLPGARAPLSAAGILPTNRGAASPGGNLQRIEKQELARATNLDTLNTDVPLFEGDSVLLVHVLPDRLSCAMLAVAQEGARQVSATICTRHRDGPPVEYALAVLPLHLRPKSPREEPEFPENLHSGWVRTRPMRQSGITLILPEPLDCLSDIYLMTRLPKGQASDAYGWSTFSDLTVRY